MTPRTLSSLRTLLCAAILLTAPRVARADDIFVRIDGIEGNAEEAAHAGWIRAHAVGNSVTATPASSGGSGGGRGSVSFSDLSVLKSVDRASPALFVSAAKSTHLRTVDVDFVRAGESGFVYFRIQLTDAIVTGVRTNASAKDQNLTEFVTFSFERIRWEYTEQRSDGSPGGKVTGCWDAGAGTAC